MTAAGTSHQIPFQAPCNVLAGGFPFGFIALAASSSARANHSRCFLNNLMFSRVHALARRRFSQIGFSRDRRRGRDRGGVQTQYWRGSVSPGLAYSQLFALSQLALHKSIPHFFKGFSLILPLF
ncbi:MAG: hypothetical protein IKJ89_06810 [Kiritimatiellae bacterium]|nr:hypothetical protein [Kiritimatiellia bacterium]